MTTARFLTVMALITVVVGLSTSSASGAVLAVKAQVSPSTISFRSAGTWVTVHVDIPYRAVNRAYPVTLRNPLGYYVTASYLKADNRGQLVAKFRLSSVKRIVAMPSTTLEIRGMTVNGVYFCGRDTVRVTR